MAKKKKQMIKIVYFDEGSATDFIYILEGGRSTDKKEHIVSRATEIALGAEAEANKSAGIFSIISAKVGAAANADFSREGSTIITKAIENTILTDYLSYAENVGKTYIRIFTDCKPYPYPESFAYFKMLTPYFKMTNGQIAVSDGLSLNPALMDEAMDSGRGYYELVADSAGETVVLRFNIKAFRNNYFISDLVKMNLDYHAVEVGSISVDNLTMQSEFADKQEKELSGFDLINQGSSINADEIKVYDVILAGVCR